MLDVLCPLVSECDTVSNELLNIILMNIVEPVKSSKKNAYNLAKELIIKCSETLESYIQNVNHFKFSIFILTRLIADWSLYTKH